MLKFYSKPVLTNETNSAYKENIHFILNYEKSNINQATNNIDLMFKSDLNSKALNDKINLKHAKVAIKISSSLFSEYKEINDINEIEISFPCEKLQKVDQLKCVLYILSDGENNYLWNDELNDDYGSDLKFNFLNNEIMAISNTEKIEYKANGDPFIIFSAEPNKKGISFSIDTPNKIQVKIGTELNESLAKLRRNGERYEVKDIIDAFTAFDSIVYALTKIILNQSLNYKEKEWYKILYFNFSYLNDKYDDLDEFIESMRSENNINIDLDEIYRIAQLILNNCIEQKLIEAGKK